MQRTISILHILVGLVCGAIAFPFIQLFLTDPGTTKGLADAGQTFLVLSVLFFWPSICLGIWGLIHFRSARPALLVLGGLYLFLFPLGSILGVLTIIATLRRRQSNERAAISSTQTINLLLVMCTTGSAIIVALSVLFHVNNEPIPAEMEVLFAPAAIVLMACLPVLINRIDWRGVAQQPGLWKQKREWHRQEMARLEFERQRLETLARDPEMAKYVSDMQRGNYWSDEAIAYDRDVTLLVTDPAIRPIERAMRDAGIPLRRGQAATLTAQCEIDRSRLYEQFPPGERYQYLEDFYEDRPSDPGEKMIISNAGTSYILVINPDPGTEAIVFPPMATIER